MSRLPYLPFVAEKGYGGCMLVPKKCPGCAEASNAVFPLDQLPWRGTHCIIIIYCIVFFCQRWGRAKLGLNDLGKSNCYFFL